MSLFDVGRAEVICDQITIHELRMLGRILKVENDCHIYANCWTQDKLHKKALVDYYDMKWGYREWTRIIPTILGREVYALARQRWIERNQRKPKQEGRDGECDG